MPVNMTEFPKTKASVEQLLDLLRCDNCSRTLHEPFTTGVCSHTLCFACCSTSVAPAGSRPKKHTGISNICPLCYIPIRPCDIKPHPQLHNLVLVARRLAKLLGNKELTPLSSLNIKAKDEDSHDSLECLSSVDYHHFESPSPSLPKKASSRSLNSSNTSPTVTALSPVECITKPSIQPVVTLTRDMEDVENMAPVESMPPPSAPPAKKFSRGRHVTARKSSEKCAKKSAEVTPQSKAKSRAKAPLASPEQSGMTEALIASSPTKTSPLKRESSVNSSSGGSGVRRSASRRKANVSGAGDGGEVELKLNSKGESVLHRAAIKNNVSELRRLLTAGLSPNARDHAGWTPLHEAALRGHAEAAECLLTDGHATVDIPGGPDLETALHEAVFNHQAEIVRLLLRHNANPTFANGQGVTPLQMCAEHLSEANQNALTNTKTHRGRWFKRQNSIEALKDIQTIHDLLTAAAAKTSELGKSLTAAPNHAASALFIERRRLRPLLLGTGLNRNQKNMMARVANLIHARVAVAMSAEVTHLVTGAQITPMKGGKHQKKAKRKKGEKVAEAAEVGITCPRTLKFLCAVLQGCWVLSFEWIETCDAMKIRVEEEAFEVTGCSTAPNTYASRRARRAREAGSAGLFHGYRFCLLGSFAYPTPDRVDLCNLLTSGGATIFSRDVTSPSRLAYIAVDDPAIAEAWMVQQGASAQESESGGESLPAPTTTAIAGDDVTAVHPHQLIALYDPRTSGLLTSTSPADEAAAAVAAATIVGRPEELVGAALQMLRPRLRSSPPTSAFGFQPIILVPATWIMDCIAAYALLPLPTISK
ncbi:BRCA1-associated RING domain protein 1 [Taenia crassiceps]|uniref:BRCA1-associated RING domain protein 1 n=1 Tax=Taenia crassiceps TaxID=6207 RepID=A0ABR4QNE7_9CEST